MITKISEFKKILESTTTDIQKVTNSKGVEFIIGAKTSWGIIDSFEENDGNIYANTTIIHKQVAGPNATAKHRKNIDELTLWPKTVKMVMPNKVKEIYDKVTNMLKDSNTTHRTIDQMDLAKLVFFDFEVDKPYYMSVINAIIVGHQEGKTSEKIYAELPYGD